MLIESTLCVIFCFSVQILQPILEIRVQEIKITIIPSKYQPDNQHKMSKLF